MGKNLLQNARKVGSDAHIIPMSSSIDDHVAAPGVSHVMSVVTARMYSACRRQMDVMVALRQKSSVVFLEKQDELTSRPSQE